MATVVRRGPISGSQEWPWFKSTQTHPFCYEISIARPEDLSIEDMRDSIAHVLERHEALRTRFVIDRSGNPIQEVLAPFSIDQFIIGTRPHQEIKTAAKVEQRLREVSAVVVMWEKELSAVLYLHKAAVDGASIGMIRSELDAILSSRRGGARLSLPPADWHPIDQAMEERSHVRAGRDSRWAGYWNEQVSASPATAIPFRWNRNGEETDVVATTMRDPELMGQCERLAKDCNVSVPAVFSALLVVAAGALTGSERIVIESVFSGRVTSRIKGSVGHYSRDIDVHYALDWSLTFADLVRDVHKRTLRSFARSHPSSVRHLSLKSEMSVPRRTPIAASFHLNYDLSRGHPNLNATLAREFRQTQVAGGHPFPFVNVFPAGSNCVVSLGASQNVLSPSESIRFLEFYCEVAESTSRMPVRGLKEVSMELEIPSPWKFPEWINLNGSWVHLRGMQEMLAGFHSVDEARVFSVHGNVMACLAVTDIQSVSENVFSYIRRVASWGSDLIVPKTIVMRESVPLKPGEYSSWIDGQEVAIMANFRPLGSDPVDERELGLARAFLALHPHVRLDMNSTYIEQGGEFIKIPAFLRLLGDVSPYRLHWREVAGVATLRDLAKSFKEAQNSSRSTPNHSSETRPQY